MPDKIKDILENSLTVNNNCTISCVGEEEFTYGDVLSASLAMVEMLHNHGFEAGDRIAICGSNSIGWIEAFFAALLGDFIPVIISDKFSLQQKQAILNQSESTALFVENQCGVKIDFSKSTSLLMAFDIHTQETLLKRNANGKEKTEKGEVCTILYSSGSTGNPKGAMITDGNLIWNMQKFSSLCPYDKGDMYVSILPFSHIFGLASDLLTCVYRGVNLHIIKGVPSPNKIYPVFQEYNPRFFFAVPLLLEKVVGAAQRGENNDMDYSRFFGNRLEHLITGGAPIPKETEHYLIDVLKLPFHTGYGMTETAPLISLGHLNDYKIGSCGECIDGQEVRIETIEGLNGAGEIQVKGPNVFAGYLSNKKETEACFTKDGWFKTGDIGRLEGRTLFITGRLKNILLFSNGVNVEATEIEAQINTINEVEESIVIQENDNITIVVHVPGNEVIVDRLIDEIKTILGEHSLTYKIGRIIVADNPLERTAKGSLKRCVPEGKVIYRGAHC